MIRRIREITAEQENFRLEPFWVTPGMEPFVAIRRDPVEPVPTGTYVVKVFQVTGYDPDGDGSLMARLAAVDAQGQTTGWTGQNIGLYPDNTWAIDSPSELDQAAETGEQAAIEAVTSERKRLAAFMADSFEKLDNNTRAVLAAMLARWAAAMTSDPSVLAELAGLLDKETTSD